MSLFKVLRGNKSFEWNDDCKKNLPTAQGVPRAATTAEQPDDRGEPLHVTYGQQSDCGRDTSPGGIPGSKASVLRFKGSFSGREPLF